MDKKELLIFPIPLFVFLCIILVLLFGTSLSSAIILSLLIALGSEVLYILFRFSAWIFYNEIVIDIDQGILKVVKKIFNRERSVNVISQRFDKRKIKFEEQNRGGQKKYILKYIDHRSVVLLVVNCEELKIEIEKLLKQY